MAVSEGGASLLHVIGARRRTQHDLDRLCRQITARAGRQATTAWVSMRVPRRHRLRPRSFSSDKALVQERVACLTFERRREFDALTVRLSRQDRMIEMLLQGELNRDEDRVEPGEPLQVALVDGHCG